MSDTWNPHCGLANEQPDVASGIPGPLRGLAGVVPAAERSSGPACTADPTELHWAGI